jgi:hypothetical protein
LTLTGLVGLASASAAAGDAQPGDGPVVRDDARPGGGPRVGDVSQVDPLAHLLDRIYLDSVVLPSGSEQVPLIPGPLSGLPGYGGQLQCSGVVIGEDRYWLVPDALGQFNAFIADHPPTGWTLYPYGGYVRSLSEYPTVSLRAYVLDAVGLHTYFHNEDLYLYYLPVDAGHTAVRASATSAGEHIGCRYG